MMFAEQWFAPEVITVSVFFGALSEGENFVFRRRGPHFVARRTCPKHSTSSDGYRWRTGRRTTCSSPRFRSLVAPEGNKRLVSR